MKASEILEIEEAISETTTVIRSDSMLVKMLDSRIMRNYVIMVITMFLWILLFYIYGTYLLFGLLPIFSFFSILYKENNECWRLLLKIATKNRMIFPQLK